VNLFQFADMLIKRGVVNAVNLDGGGSSLLMEGDTILNYPGDYCHIDGADPLFQCPRNVSTVLCVHDIEECSHGDCNCNDPWYGKKCEFINCTKTDCTRHGVCTNGKCTCEAGWYGKLCEQPCSRNRYGLGCKSVCNYCVLNKSFCHHVTGQCVCYPGFTGEKCNKICDGDHYGVNCAQKCSCVHGTCSRIDGFCTCDEGWAGKKCDKQKWL
ncbi:PREDICTED: multiple epidermal growth factor-like domains protein 11, partial [Amphimedon queenslandica]|uniref:EGF-like domain-containing protein n=2 Tax=Amphimedon queenslandica TaxID=400682 RepID=A0AAN0JZI5_AMPQE